MVSAWDVAATTPDPELPMLTVAELGILRAVTQDGDTVTATITPTYSGCPAMREISLDLRARLQRAGYRHVAVHTRLAPAWSSDWITEAGRRKLSESGIAPPQATRNPHGPIPLTLTPRPSAPCPRCGSVRTTETAAFGSTACTSLHRCTDCHEPFESMKAI